MGEEVALSSSSMVLSLWLPALGSIFGGCCSNVFTIEKLLKDTPKITNFVTLVQFIFISAVGGCLNLELVDGWKPQLKPRQVALRRWLIHVGFFFITSILNNYVLNLNVSMPIHVIFRSSGTIFTMFIGRVFMKKKYNQYQVFSGGCLTLGLLLTTIGNSSMKIDSKSLSGLSNMDYKRSLSFTAISEFFLSGAWQRAVMLAIERVNLGIVLLILASVLISINGFLLEATFKSITDKQQGKNLWKEALFYQHVFSLPLFILLLGKSVVGESQAFMASIFDNLSQTGTSRNVIFSNPRALMPLYLLILNVITQYICVRGVNRLSSHANSLTVSVVLLLRKFTSLVLSIVVFENSLDWLCWVGIGFIFCGTGLYSYGSSLNKGKKDNDAKKDEMKDPNINDSKSNKVNNDPKQEKL
ncbi:Yea4 protein [Saccharomycopsis crataegensis]|uniref:Yea4 protein n=1 Tax=Saccharomycopsis crataegensis TaxID=43959 RepID=A0AAV5QVA0_9ASCO|nr:Yea4 protein [Saccharomycopsis crataegensis]